MHFGTKNVNFRNEQDTKRLFQRIKSTYITVPVDVKFAAERFNNYRPYIMAGVTPAFDLTVKKQKQYLLKNADCYLELGMGCDFYLPFFKLCPEVKFCFGLKNLLETNRPDLQDNPAMEVFTKSMSKVKNSMVVLTFYFE